MSKNFIHFNNQPRGNAIGANNYGVNGPVSLIKCKDKNNCVLITH